MNYSAFFTDATSVLNWFTTSANSIISFLLGNPVTGVPIYIGLIAALVYLIKYIISLGGGKSGRGKEG